jgi:deazaflavin-dependent oxidoreductase (nitroreductase family)
LYLLPAMPSDAQPEQSLYLTTSGRRTRLPRTIEIWFTEFQGCFYCIAEYDTSKWVGNIRANPAATWRVGERHFAGKARVLDPQRDAYALMMVQQLSRAKYGWGEGTVVELKPDLAAK